MADDNSENIGGISVTVGADISDLEAALEAAQQAAEDASTAIWQALSIARDTGMDDLANSLTAVSGAADQVQEALQGTTEGIAGLNNLGQSAEDAAASANDLNAAASQTAGAMGDVSSGANEAGDSLENLKQNEDDAQEASDGLLDSLVAFAGARIAAGAIEDFAESALTAYGNIQKADISLTALTGSAAQASATIAQLEQLALNKALNFDQLLAADQRMTAFGIDTAKIPGLLESAANAAGATGLSFERVSQALIRITSSGQVAARSLVQLGINTQVLGEAMGVTSDQVTKAFKALDQTQRIDVLTEAMSKFDGIAEKVAASLPGQWQAVQTQLEIVFRGIGEALAPVAMQLIGFIREDILPAVQELVDGFNSLDPGTKEFIVGVTGAALALIPLAAGLAGFALALRGLQTLIPVVTGLAKAFSIEGLGGIAAAAGEIAVPIAVVALGIEGLAKAVSVFTGKETSIKDVFETAKDGADLFTDSVLALHDAIAGPTIAVINDLSLALSTLKGWYDQATDSAGKLAAKQNDLVDATKKAGASALAAASAAKDQKLEIDANTSAASIAADMHQALSVKLGVERQALQDAKEALAEAQVGYSLGTVTGDAYAKALDAVDKAQKALNTTLAEANPPLTQLQIKTEQFRAAMASLGPPMAAYLNQSQEQRVETEAQQVSLDELNLKWKETQLALQQATIAYDALALGAKNTTEANTQLAALAERVSAALGKEQAALAALIKDLDAMPKGETAFNPAPIDKVAQAIDDATGFAEKYAAFIPTLESVDQEWAKQAGHINKLAKYDLPDAIKAYQDYIKALEGVDAPLGQIIAAQEKLDQMQIDAASQAGEDATAQIIDLVNLQEQTQALATDAQGLGNIYKGLAKTFDDTFKDLGASLTQVIVGTKSVSAAFKEMGQKIASDIVSTLIDGALAKLKAAIVESLAGISSGPIGSIAGGISSALGGGGKNAAGAQMQAAVTQFHAAVTQDQAATTQFTTGVTTFDEATTFFDETTSIFDDSVATYDAATSTYDAAVTTFDAAVAASDTATAAFVGAVTAFTTAVATFAADSAGSGIGGIFSMLLPFAAEGADVTQSGLFYLHKDEVVLPPQLANVFRGLAENAGGGGSLTNNFAPQITLQVPEQTNADLHALTNAIAHLALPSPTVNVAGANVAAPNVDITAPEGSQGAPAEAAPIPTLPSGNLQLSDDLHALTNAIARISLPEQPDVTVAPTVNQAPLSLGASPPISLPVASAGQNAAEPGSIALSPESLNDLRGLTTALKAMSSPSLAQTPGPTQSAASFSMAPTAQSTAATVSFSFPNAQFHGISSQTANEFMDYVVKNTRRAGARW